MHSILESTYSNHDLYKPKQHFASYNQFSDIQNKYHYLSESTSEPIYQQYSIESLSPSDIKIEPNIDKKQCPNRHTKASSVKSKKRKTSGPTTVKTPCLVCDDQASGLHYGVHTCEGCKSFYRRSILSGISYRCMNMNNCPITPLTRNLCQCCRFKKCIDVGMDRDASRLGRPPKQLNPGATDSDNDQDKMSSNENDRSISSQSPLDSFTSIKLESIFPECLFEHHQKISVPKMHQDLLRKLSSMLIYQERLLTNIEAKELDHLTRVIINAHLRFCAFTTEKIQAKIQENPPIWAYSIVNDVTSDPALVWANWQRDLPLENILKTFQFYTFFQEIEQNDKICLLRYGAFETLLVSWFTLFDVEQNLMLTTDFSAYMDRDFIKTINTLGLFVLEIFDLGMKANHFRWTNSDIALLNALLLMNPKRPGLCDKDRIEQIEAKLMQILHRHLRRHHPDEPNIFLDILQLIPSIQEVNQIHLNAVRYIKQHKQHIFESISGIYRTIYADFS